MVRSLCSFISGIPGSPTWLAVINMETVKGPSDCMQEAINTGLFLLPLHSPSPPPFTPPPPLLRSPPLLPLLPLHSYPPLLPFTPPPPLLPSTPPLHSSPSTPTLHSSPSLLPLHSYPPLLSCHSSPSTPPIHSSPANSSPRYECKASHEQCMLICTREYTEHVHMRGCMWIRNAW